MAYSLHWVAWHTVEAIVLMLSPDFPHSQPTPNCYGSVRELARCGHQICEAAQPASLAVAGEMGAVSLEAQVQAPALSLTSLGFFVLGFFFFFLFF